MAEKVTFKTKVGKLMWVQIQPGGVDQSMAKDGSKMQKVASVQFDDNSPELAEMKENLQNIWEEMRKSKNIKQVEPKSNGMRVDKDKETKLPKGTTSIIFKTGATYKDGGDVVIPIYNAKGQRVDLNGERIGNGSLGIIHGEAALYEFAGTFGITLYLKGIQLVKLEAVTDGIEAEDLTAMYPDAYGETFEGNVDAVAPADTTPNL